MKVAKLNTVLTKMSVLFGELEAEIQVVRDWWDDRTEKWQESERGCEQEDLITELESRGEELSDALNNVLEQVEEMK